MLFGLRSRAPVLLPRRAPLSPHLPGPINLEAGSHSRHPRHARHECSSGRGVTRPPQHRRRTRSEQLQQETRGTRGRSPRTLDAQSAESLSNAVTPRAAPRTRIRSAEHSWTGLQGARSTAADQVGGAALRLHLATARTRLRIAETRASSAASARNPRHARAKPEE